MIVFYIFTAILIWLSFKSFLGGIRYLDYFGTELNKPRSAFTPPVTVVVPCRGRDAELKENLLSVVEQQCPEYEVIFVVDDDDDEAVPIIREIMAGTSTHSRLIVAGKADGCSQKVANLREAVLHASDSSQALVFVDSDARPSRNWLTSLVAPLADPSVGAATGYRWFISPHPTFASEMRSAWNASIASALGPNTGSNFCWGGSMAIRRDVFERLGIRDKWLGTLSDDFTVTRAMTAARLPIVFVPQALTASVEGCSFRELLEFTTRQMKITRVYSPKLWLMSLFGSLVFNAVLIAALAIVIFSRTNDTAVIAAISTLISVATFSTAKAWLRLRAVKLVLTQYAPELGRQFWTQNTLWLLTPALFLFNSIAAAFSRQMTWRGTRYLLKSPSETVIIAPSIGRN